MAHIIRRAPERQARRHRPSKARYSLFYAAPMQRDAALFLGAIGTRNISPILSIRAICSLAGTPSHQNVSHTPVSSATGIQFLRRFVCVQLAGSWCQGIRLPCERHLPSQYSAQLRQQLSRQMLQLTHSRSPPARRYIVNTDRAGNGIE